MHGRDTCFLGSALNCAACQFLAMAFSDLPEIAVQQILCYARGRSIAGTNKYARVCRQWRVAEDHEPLQLFMNLSHLSEEDLAKATAWLSRHGQTVEVLAVESSFADASGGLGWIGSTAPALQQLKRLEVAGEHSLWHLVPVLQQLPQLQHLAAGVSLACACGGKSCEHGWPQRWPCRAFVSPSRTSQFDRWQVPDMEKLCPQLTSLNLTLHPSSKGRGISDKLLAPLLSPRLQQLTLALQHDMTHVLDIRDTDLGHLSALQQLTLDGVSLKVKDAGGVAQVLSGLQQLRVCHPRVPLTHDMNRNLDCLAPQVTEYEVCVIDQDVSPLASFEHLTRLVLIGTVPEGTADALAALTGLHELGLLGPVSDSTVEVVEQAAGMVQLRSLQLEAWSGDPEALAPGVAQCTQLTSLVLVCSLKRSRAGIWPSALRHLPGLRCLAVRAPLLVEDQGAWLAALTQLTRLCVTLDELKPGWFEQYTEHTMEQQQQRLRAYHGNACKLWQQQVQRWVPGLQQVVFWVETDRYIQAFVPMCWRLPGTGPGSLQVTAWLEEQDSSAPGWARPFRPCPHLPGVWELQGAAQGKPWHLLPAPR